MAEKPEKPEKPEAKTPPAPPRPVRLDVTSSGKNGQYTFDVQVMSDKGRGIKARVLIVEGTHVRNVKDTDEDGFLENYQAQPFKDEEQEFLFSVVSTDLRYEITLDGPEHEPKPRKKIKPIAGGFWANFHNVAKQYQKRKGN